MISAPIKEAAVRHVLLSAALLAGCDAPPGDPVPPPAPGDRTLGMNDVTMLLPLPAGGAPPTLLRVDGPGAALVPRALYERLALAPGDVVSRYEDLHVVAVRFDLCDRIRPEPCREDRDGQLRLVLQPVSAGAALDVALHAFYPIPRAELPGVVDELRGLSRLQGEPYASPLKVSPALSGQRAGYADGLRALVTRYAREDRLLRLTLFAQHARAAALNWAFRGLERRGADYEDMVIPGVRAPAQRVILLGGDVSYDVTPAVDEPSGLTLALAAPRFQAASADARRQALAALAAVESPRAHTAETAQCVACHVSSFLTGRRAAAAGVAPEAIEGRYGSTYDLSIGAGISAGNERSLRALGWFFTMPALSQRVANETAEVLAEMEHRFPAR